MLREDFPVLLASEVDPFENAHQQREMTREAVDGFPVLSASVSPAKQQARVDFGDVPSSKRSRFDDPLLSSLDAYDAGLNVGLQLAFLEAHVQDDLELERRDAPAEAYEGTTIAAENPEFVAPEVPVSEPMLISQTLDMINQGISAGPCIVLKELLPDSNELMPVWVHPTSRVLKLDKLVEPVCGVTPEGLMEVDGGEGGGTWVPTQIESPDFATPLDSTVTLSLEELIPPLYSSNSAWLELLTARALRLAADHFAGCNHPDGATASGRRPWTSTSMADEAQVDPLQTNDAWAAAIVKRARVADGMDVEDDVSDQVVPNTTTMGGGEVLSTTPGVGGDAMTTTPHVVGAVQLTTAPPAMVEVFDMGTMHKYLEGIQTSISQLMGLTALGPVVKQCEEALLQNNHRLGSIEERLNCLEARSDGGKGGGKMGKKQPAPAMGSEAAAALVGDPFTGNGGEWRGKGGDLYTRGGKGSKDATAGPWVPTKLFLRGWSPYDEAVHPRARKGISKEEAAHLYELILSRIPHENARVIQGASYPFFNNTQLVITMKDNTPRELVWEASKAINAVVKGEGFELPASLARIGSVRLYCQVDAPEWQRVRRGLLAKASSWLVKSKAVEERLVRKDWASGCLWATSHSGESLMVGLAERGRSGEVQWTWQPLALEHLGIPEQAVEGFDKTIF